MLLTFALIRVYRASACCVCRTRYCFTNSVCPSVCLSVFSSRCGIVCKRMHTSSNSF